MSKNYESIKKLCLVFVVFLTMYLLHCLANSRVTENYENSNEENLEEENFKNHNCAAAPHPQCNNYSVHGPAPTCPTGKTSPCEPSGKFPDDNLPACFPTSQLSPDELLPNDECNLWSTNNPNASPDLSNRNFLQAGWATGVSTVGSTMRNANLQLRSDPPNPQKVVSPWMQTTMGPDLARKPLELGTCS